MRVRVKALSKEEYAIGLRIGQVLDVMSDHGAYYLCVIRLNGRRFKIHMDYGQVEIVE